MPADLIDRIYEAAFVPDEWPNVFERINALSNSAAGAIFLFDDGAAPKGRSQDQVQPLFDEFMAGDIWQMSASVQSMYRARPSSFVLVDDFMTAEQIANDPVRISARAFGIGSNICTAVPMPSGELVTFVFQRWIKDGIYDESSIDRLNSLRPHLARAGLLAARLGLERAESTVSALKMIGLPAAVLAASGRVLASNSLLDAAAGSLFLPTAFGGIAISSAVADALFQESIAQARHDLSIRSIPIPAREGQPALVVHLLPLRRAAHDIFSGGDILVAATAVNASAVVPSASVLNGLFDLTPSEARIAAVLASGRSLKDAAADSGITFKSGRTYLERIFAKTGTRRQSELVALLMSAHPLPVPHSNSS